MNQAHNEKKYACIGLALLILLALAAMIGTSFHICAYSKETIAITGMLEEVSSSPNCTIELCVDGNSYRLYKDNRYSKRSFGVLDNMALGTLGNVLHSRIGKVVSLEYVQVEATLNVVQLSIEGTDYVCKDVAIRDFIGYEGTTRTIWGTVLGAAVILLFLIWKGIIR